MCGWSLIKNAMQFWFYFKCIMSLGCFASVHGQTTQALDNWWTPPGIPVHICALISIFRLERWENLISPWKYFVCFFPLWRRLENYIRKLESPGNSIWSILASSSRLTDTFRTFYASLLKVIRPIRVFSKSHRPMQESRLSVLHSNCILRHTLAKFWYLHF